MGLFCFVNIMSGDNNSSVSSFGDVYQMIPNTEKNCNFLFFILLRKYQLSKDIYFCLKSGSTPTVGSSKISSSGS